MKNRGSTELHTNKNGTSKPASTSQLVFKYIRKLKWLLANRRPEFEWMNEAWNNRRRDDCGILLIYLHMRPDVFPSSTRVTINLRMELVHGVNYVSPLSPNKKIVHFPWREGAGAVHEPPVAPSWNKTRVTGEAALAIIRGRQVPVGRYEADSRNTALTPPCSD